MSMNSHRLERHLAIASAAVVGLMCAARSAEAAIVWSGIVNINIPVNIDGVYLNVATGATGASGTVVPGWDLNPWGSSSLNMFSPSAMPSGAYVGSGSSYTNLAPFSLISTASTFAGGGVATPDGSLVLNSSQNLIGFRFYNENTALYHFGWMRISLGVTLTAPRTIVEYAWETAGGIITPLTEGDEPVGILAGAIPAPGALTVLIAGAFVGVRRRRRDSLCERRLGSGNARQHDG